jgi:hypothetical protein
MGAKRPLKLCFALFVASAACGDAAQKPKDAAPPGQGAPDGSPPDGSTTDGGAKPAFRCKRNDPQRSPFFGDLHVHTALSLDANLQGARLRPMDAYRFARGEEVGLPPYDDQGEPSRKLKLDRPLDFVAVSDHAEFLGLVTTCLTQGLDGYDSEACMRYRDAPDSAFLSFNSALGADQASAGYIAPCTKDNDFCGGAAVSTWKEVQRAAKDANDTSDDCAFTSFVAYEWSASPGTKNLHRNVIFRGEEVPELPFSYFDGSQEEELWDALSKDCLDADSGCDVLTIPHNSNLSAGLMFERLDSKGEPIDRAYAERRRAFEPLVEIFQHKGASECLPDMGPDELCSFEVMPYNTLGSTALGGSGDKLVASDFLRDALGQGLKLWDKLGVNPFAYGFVASTDTHLGVSGAVEEYAFQGHGGAGSSARTTHPAGLVDSAWLNPGGLAVLWAEENSRDALYAAMKRREAYATSGPRIVLRTFAGYDIAKDACNDADFVKHGYEHGVPMGGELGEPTGNAKPRVAVWALADAGSKAHPGGQLERIQIIKGWLEDGQPKIAVRDVAGKAGISKVDESTCEPDGKGAAELCAVFTDEDFDPKLPTFYYARVVEAPSCRWHKRACLAAQVDCTDPATIGEGLAGCCTGYPDVIQERAWSSPMFYTPPS